MCVIIYSILFLKLFFYGNYTVYTIKSENLNDLFLEMLEYLK